VRWGLFSDIHANREALEAVLASMAREKPDRLICLGDVVGYGADPNACVAMVRDSGAAVVAGNHDHAALALLDVGDFNDQARFAINWTRKELTEGSSAWLREQPMTLAEADLLAVHASPFEPRTWNYVLGAWDALQQFPHYQERIAFVGHSHVPGLYLRTAGGVEEWPLPANEPIDLPKDFKALVNIGSVGQPRDRDPRAAWLLYDDDSRTLILNRVEYDVAAAQARIYEAGLPPFLGYRLGMGV
jgi:diadenosine tetraphosphatase ApaH/serine/threonine PP2A family protein phosphatase